MQIQPYLFFNGRCEEAIEFYQSALGARIEVMMTYKECPDPMPPGMLPPGSENKVMHATLRIGDAVVMASDGECGGATRFDGFSLSLMVETAVEAERLYKALSDGGEVRMPLGKTFFSPCFGMLVDRFGVGWMVNMPGQ